MFAKHLLRSSLLVVAICGATLMSAQQANQASKSNGSKTITGCVNKGQENGGFYLQDKSGKTWELTNSASKVSKHVGHTVTLTGTSTHEPKAEEAKMATTEK